MTMSRHSAHITVVTSAFILLSSSTIGYATQALSFDLNEDIAAGSPSLRRSSSSHGLDVERSQSSRSLKDSSSPLPVDSMQKVAPPSLKRAAASLKLEEDTSRASKRPRRSATSQAQDKEKASDSQKMKRTSSIPAMEEEKKIRQKRSSSSRVLDEKKSTDSLKPSESFSLPVPGLISDNPRRTALLRVAELTQKAKRGDAGAIVEARSLRREHRIKDVELFIQPKEKQDPTKVQALPLEDQLEAALRVPADSMYLVPEDVRWAILNHAVEKCQDDEQRVQTRTDLMIKLGLNRPVMTPSQELAIEEIAQLGKDIAAHGYRQVQEDIEREKLEKKKEELQKNEQTLLTVKSEKKLTLQIDEDPPQLTSIRSEIAETEQSLATLKEAEAKRHEKMRSIHTKQDPHYEKIDKFHGIKRNKGKQ